MTFEKKYMLEHPDANITDIIRKYCPYEKGLIAAKDLSCECDCIECWNQEIPGTEVKTEPAKILYICDRRACHNCSYPNCAHTSDINHAVNFKCENGYFVEKDGDEYNHMSPEKFMEWLKSNLGWARLGCDDVAEVVEYEPKVTVASIDIDEPSNMAIDLDSIDISKEIEMLKKKKREAEVLKAIAMNALVEIAKGTTDDDT